MLDNFDTYLKIEDYLNGNLSTADSMAFEQEMNVNVELQELVEDYRLADTLMEEQEILNVNQKLSQIHQNSIRRKNILKGGLGLLVISAIAISLFFIPSNKKEVVENVKLQPNNQEATPFLNTESTPFKTIDSMSEVALSTTIKKSKEKEESSELIDTISYIEEPEIITSKEIAIPKLSKPDSILKPIDLTPLVSIMERKDTVTEEPCTLSLAISNIEKTNTCLKKQTGTLLITSEESDLLFSIDNKKNYSSNPYFNHLSEGVYSVSIKSIQNKCESDVIEISIQGEQCNYIIDPNKLVYLDKSLEDFEEEATVEVLIFNKIGNLVYNKTVLTSENFTWNGNSNINQPLPMGNYTYLIKSGNKISQGEITIIR